MRGARGQESLNPFADPRSASINGPARAEADGNPHGGQYLRHRGRITVVTDVQPYGPGARGGLQQGMRILAVDGHPVNDVASFRDARDFGSP